MTNFLKALFLTMLLLSGQATLASPRADANYIAQRDLDQDSLKFVRYFLKRAFAGVYTRPFAELGIEVIDEDQIIELIPDEDIAPYIDRLLIQKTELYISIFTPEQLAFLAENLRKDKTASLQELLSEEYRQELAAAREEARVTAPSSGPVDLHVQALEEWIAQVDAMTEVLSDNTDLIGMSVAVSIAHIIQLNAYGHEIARLQRELDNPVAIAALKKHGVLRFANPVQRQALLRQLSAFEEKSGVRFSRPPSTNSGSN